jgi:hypothetical protein
MDIGEVSSGYDFERKVLGVASVDVSPKVKCFFRRKTKFRKAVKIVKDIQDILEWNPRSPSTEVAQMIYKNICVGLNKYSCKLCFFSALGTALDYRYGIDCFFTLEIGGRESIVTVDLSIRKKREQKADIVIAVDDIRSDNVYNISRQITKKLLARTYSHYSKNKSEKYKDKYVFKTSH